jgi:16S rRNA (guanine966-N2)-methyltransferase
VTRIVAGVAKGRRLAVPDAGTRPTSDRAREAVFAILESRWGPLAGARVVDLYAGSGALGLEAASRGATSVEFVESDRSAVRTLRSNLDAVGLAGLRVRPVPVERWLRGRPSVTAPDAGGDVGPFDLVLVDPPYAVSGEHITRVLGELAETGRLRPGAWVVVERAHRTGAFGWPSSYQAELDRRYGEAHVWFGCFGSVAAC